MQDARSSMTEVSASPPEKPLKDIPEESSPSPSQQKRRSLDGRVEAGLSGGRTVSWAGDQDGQPTELVRAFI